jgi:hypothetical protein
MPHIFRAPGNRFAGKPTMRPCSAWVLCALLLILSANAKLARYESHRQNLKLASTQTYLDGEEARRELSKTTPLVLWSVGAIAVLLIVTTREAVFPGAPPSSPQLKGFDPEAHLRPPPVR